MSDAPGPQNEPLLDAMRLLARNRDDWHRKQVYQEVLRAELVLALSQAAPAEQPLRLEDLEVADELGGHPSYAVFTDEAGLRKWRSSHEHYALIGGVALVLLLNSGKVGSLLINRGGKVGGELYGNEIDTMARAVTGALSSQS